jgi:CARDB protein
MPPFERRRRRRSLTTTLVIVLVVVVALVLLIGGAVRVGRASGPYWTDLNRSYAAQGTTLIDRSNETGSQLRTLVAGMPQLTRPALQQQLDSLVTASSQTATSGAALAPPTPSGHLGKDFAGVLADRAEAVTETRAAVDGLLGMAPLPVVGAPTTSTTPAPKALLTSDQATADLAGAGRLLHAADQAYAAVRRQFRAAPGGAALPRSVWLRQPWTAGTASTLVDQLSGSHSLLADHRVVLLPHGIRLTPPVVPPTTPPPPAATVTPTHSLSVTAVVANEGNVDEPAVTVSVAVQGGATHSRTVDLAAGRSQAVVLPSIPVTPGQTYALTVSVTAPAAPTDRTGTTRTFTIKVAPASTASSTAP